MGASNQRDTELGLRIYFVTPAKGDIHAPSSRRDLRIESAIAKDAR